MECPICRKEGLDFKGEVKQFEREYGSLEKDYIANQLLIFHLFECMNCNIKLYKQISEEFLKKWD